MWSLKRPAEDQTAAPEQLKATYTRLTDLPGSELFPSISPDENYLVYTKRDGKDFDLFLQRIGGKNPVNLTKDSEDNDLSGAFSPDGQSIAFRSDQRGAESM